MILRLIEPKILFFSLLVIIYGLYSCVREEIIPYNNIGESKIVVIGFLTPTVKIEIYVGHSQPFGKQNYQPTDFIEQNANVTIEDENGNAKVLSSTIAYPSIYSCPQSEFPIIAGKKYTISVKGKTGEVNASTIVPIKAAVWDVTSLTGPEDYFYYNFSGSWKTATNPIDVYYGVSIKSNGKLIDSKTNEGINLIDSIYTVKREIYLANSQSIEAILLTKDKAFTDFSSKTDLTLQVLENLKSSAFSDIISGFKGVIPNAGNVNGGIGVFGSYLKNSKTINK